MSNHISDVQEWLDKEVLREAGISPEEIPFESIQKLINHSELTDDHIRKIYAVIGFMFKDACNAMEEGQAKTYRAQSVNELFERIQEEMGLPMPLDMAPDYEKIPEAANDLPRIQLIT